jgi:hypothetical protein
VGEVGMTKKDLGLLGRIKLSLVKFMFGISDNKEKPKLKPESYLDLISFNNLRLLIYLPSGLVTAEKVELGDMVKEDIPFLKLKKGDFWLIRKDGSMIGVSIKSMWFVENQPTWIINKEEYKI